MAEKIVEELSKYASRNKAIPKPNLSRSTLKYICNTFEGYDGSFDDIARLIAGKYEDWKEAQFKGGPMLRYLRVSTLFGSPDKLNKYLDETHDFEYIDPVQSEIRECIEIANNAEASNQERQKARERHAALIEQRKAAQ